MDAQFPGVPECLDHLGFLGQVRVRPVLHIALVGEGLKVRAVFDAIRRVEIDHLNLASHALLRQERVHDKQTVACGEPVRPSFFMVVEIERLAQG